MRKRLERKKDAFDLGPFEVPVAIAALLWLAVALIVMVTPGAAPVPVLIVIGLLLVGGLYFPGMLMFDRKSSGPSRATSLSSRSGTVRVQAAIHGRSMEEEARDILRSALSRALA